MRKMNYLIVGCIAAILFTACELGSGKDDVYKFESRGTVAVKNGKGDLDSILYSCLGCDSLITEERIFKAMVNRATEDLKGKLNFPLSFVPTKISFMVSKKDNERYYEDDSLITNLWLVFATYEYIASNAYNTQIAGTSESSFYIKDGVVQNGIENKIKLEALKFNKDGLINRDLALYDDRGKHVIVSPYYNEKKKSFNLHVNTSHTCVDDRAELIIVFDDKSQYSMFAWNAFNCDADSYYTISKKDIKAISEKPVRAIGVHSRGDLVMCFLEKNQVDYFIELAKLLN